MDTDDTNIYVEEPRIGDERIIEVVTQANPHVYRSVDGFRGEHVIVQGKVGRHVAVATDVPLKVGSLIHARCLYVNGSKTCSVWERIDDF